MPSHIQSTRWGADEMYDRSSIAVVVPAYNEEPFVGDVLETIPDFVDRIYAIDDCSTDRTWTEIRAQARQTVAVGSAIQGGHHATDRIVPIRHPSNLGRGAAIKTGYRCAMGDGIDVVAVMDADGQMDPDQLDRLIDPVVSGDADYAKGNRLGRLDHLDGMSAWRLFGNLVLTVLTKLASGYWRMRDPQNGYTAISRSALNKIDLAELYDEYGFLNDLLIELNAHGCRVVNVGMPAIYGLEQSGIRYSTFVPELSRILLQGWFRRLKRKYYSRRVPPASPLGTWVLGSRISGTSRLLSGSVGRALGKILGGWRSLAVKALPRGDTTPGQVTREESSLDE